jgi:hypothetical protein
MSFCESIMRRSSKNFSMYKLSSTPEIQFIEHLIAIRKAEISTPELISRLNSMLQIKILLTSAPEYCWRRFLVPASTPLFVLHDQILCAIMGWARGYHGYVFERVSDGTVLGPA